MVASLLILTDFFQAADRALDYTSNLAGEIGARLVLLHVRRDSVLDPEMFTGQLSNLSQEAIALALNSVAGNLAVPVVAEVGHGQVAYALADAVSRHHPTLVVLGRPDYSDLPDELIQTTSLDILRTAPYPMLVVPHTLVTTTPPRRVLLAVDGESFSLGAHAGAIRHLLAALHAELTIVHVAPVAAAEAAPDPAIWDSAVQTGLAVELPKAVRTRTVVHHHPGEGILQAARPEDFDLVMVVARPRSFLGQLFHHSVTAHVLLHSALPVLVLPATE
ncbi:universal stress protein [Hymenobacter lutimineralis]|uniref:Universal stress protein n=1 Tax=Hymenobacter lutimineralis TaxID=2606448 RepID=A0A5D6UWD6_9BACT|nr:universal stress protein [Hymenobacter lutimineralis]TYZ08061.1 universal stress protein [Hymenobacter lutimineralis]